MIKENEVRFEKATGFKNVCRAILPGKSQINPFLDGSICDPDGLSTECKCGRT